MTIYVDGRGNDFYKKSEFSDSPGSASSPMKTASDGGFVFSGKIGINKDSPGAWLDIQNTDGFSNSLRIKNASFQFSNPIVVQSYDNAAIYYLDADGNNFHGWTGTSIGSNYKLASDSSPGQNAGNFQFTWEDDTHATRKSQFKLLTYDQTSFVESLILTTTNATFVGGATFQNTVQINTGAADSIGQIIQGAASQSANLTEWQDSTGSVVASVLPNGTGNIAQFGDGSTSDMYISLAGTRARFGFESGHVSIRGQSAREIRFFVDANADPSMTIKVGGEVNIGNGVGNLGASLGVVSLDATTIGQIIQGAASQTANLTEWQDSTGTILAAIERSGRLGLSNGNTTLPGVHFLGDTNTGLYRAASDTIGVVCGSNEAAHFDDDTTAGKHPFPLFTM